MLIFWVIMAVIVAMIANSKGKSPISWFFYGLVIWPIALVHILISQRDNGDNYPNNGRNSTSGTPRNDGRHIKSIISTCSECGSTNKSAEWSLTSWCGQCKKTTERINHTCECGEQIVSGQKTCPSCNSHIINNNPIHKELERACPFCAELIKAKAIKCKHCGSDVEPLPEKQRPVAKKIIQDTQVVKANPIKIQPSMSKTPESKPSKKEFSFPVKELFFVLLFIVIGIGFSAYRQLAPDQKVSSTHKEQVIETATDKTATDKIEIAKSLVSEEKYEEAIQYIEQQAWNSELAKLKTSTRIKLARKNINRLEPLVRKNRKAQDIKLLYKNYLELASLDYKNTDKQAYDRAEKMRNAIVEKELFAEVKKVPSSDIEKNAKIYKELVRLNPRSKLYKDKLAYYEKKLEASKPESCYSLGYRGGICAGKSMVGIACDPRNDIVIPVRCRNKDDTARGMKAGIKYAYDSLGVPYQ